MAPRRWLIDGELKYCRMPLFSYSRTSHVAFVFNEGGRGLTVSLYRRPWGLRIYLAGRVWDWGKR